MNVQVIARADGRSAVAAAAYRAGERLRDERAGKYFDFRKKHEVSFRAIYAPQGAPEWASVRERLWNEVERSEKRRDAQLAREIEVALPAELPKRKQVALLKYFVQHHLVGKGMVADVSLHDKPGNPHAHILVTMRSLAPDGFGGKQRKWNTKEFLEFLRLGWAASANYYLRRSGWPACIDHRSLAAQGIDREPMEHEGPVRHAMRKRGVGSDVATRNEQRRQGRMTMSEKLAPKPATGSPQDSEIEDHHSVVFWQDNSYRRKHATSELFSREYRAMLDELFPGGDVVREESAAHAWFHYRFKLRDGAIRDYGYCIRCEEGTPEEIGATLKLIKAKGWKGIAVSGPLDFRRMFFQKAVLEGYPPEQITGYTPTQGEVEALKAMMPQSFPQKAAPELVLASTHDDGGEKRGANAAEVLQPRRPRPGW